MNNRLPGRSAVVTHLRLSGVIGLLFLAAAATKGSPLPDAVVSEVSVSRTFFNPSLGQKIQISLTAGEAGSLSLLIVDRDGFLVRKLVSDHAVQAGKVGFDWDGRTDEGEIVPDEAYSLKIELGKALQSPSYFPANVIPEQLPPPRALYDRSSGVLSYKLAVPARVHIQAGSAQLNKAGQAHGPVLKTLANREPRAGGAVIETWNGWDESGTIRVCDLPYFAIAVAATPLPENSIITVGNRERSFFDWVRARRGQSLLTVSTADHSHHRGLQSIDDVAPRLQLQLRNASWSAAERLWMTSQKAIEVTTSVEGPTAEAFLRHPGKLMIFLDLKNIRTQPATGIDPSVSAPTAGLSPGPHQVTLNWVSDYGPVAVNSVLFRVERPRDAKTASK